MSNEGGCNKCYSLYERKLEGAFGFLGRFISRHPVKILIVCVLVNGTFMTGFLNLKVENDVEILYTPENSQSLRDREVLRRLYQDPTSNFKSYQLADFGKYVEVMIISKNKSNIMSQPFVDEIKNIDSYIQNSIVVRDSPGNNYTYQNLCAIDLTDCHITGNVLLTSSFQQYFVARNVTFPYFNQNLLSPVLAEVVSKKGRLTSTIGVRMRYFLRQNTSQLASLWEEKFITEMKKFQTKLTELAYSHSESLAKELNQNTSGDIKFFSITFALMITFSYLVLTSMNCNNVGNRMNMGTPGVLAAVLAIGSALGFVSGVGVDFTNIVGVMPFLVIGIGIDDMFILMSGLADAPQIPEHSTAERIEFMMKKSGVAITITSLTDLLAFVIGATSVFRSIRYFCVYTGVAIFFCYLNQLFFMTPAIAINEFRTKKRKHCLCCCLTSKTTDDLEREGRSNCYIKCFGGDHPKARKDLENPLEIFPKKFVKIVLKSIVGKILIVGSMLGYIAISIFGFVNLEQGLSLYNLVSKNSYFHRYSIWDEKYFSTEPIITLCIKHEQDYSSTSIQTQISSVISMAKRDSLVDDNFEINWLAAYRNSSPYNTSSEAAFIIGLKAFLTSAKMFTNDIVFDPSSSKIISSKVYVKSVNIKSSTDLGSLMLRMRDITRGTSLPCFFYTPAFIFFEQYVQILPSTFQTVGIAVAVMLIVTFIFMPKPLLVFIVGLTLVSILVGIFGFMYYWDLTLSSITMIHLVMSVGFSVDFSVHICHAFLSVDGGDRSDILDKALDRSGGPIFNAAISSLIGISMLALSSSYIFLSFGKLMFLVIVIGLVHAAFFLPFILYIIIPCFKSVSKSNTKINSTSTIAHVSSQGHAKSNIAIHVPGSHFKVNAFDPDSSRHRGKFEPTIDGFTKYTNEPKNN